MTGKAAARGYKYPLDVIAQALWDLSTGGSYVRTSIAARVAIGLPEPDPKMRRNAGRLTADWCEVFAPVLWEQPLAQEPRAHRRTAEQGRRGRQRLRCPSRQWLDSGQERSLYDEQTIQQFLDGDS